MQIVVSPHQRLHLEGDDFEKYSDLKNAFSEGSGCGLLFLDFAQTNLFEDETFVYWKDFARLYLSLFAATPNLDQLDLKKNPIEIKLSDEDVDRLLATVPAAKGAEYVNRDCLEFLWKEIELTLRSQIVESGKTVETFFSSRHSHWNLLGRVCFHLAENKKSIALRVDGKKSVETPFAFLATYAHQASNEGKIQHLPLNRALEEYSKQKNILLRLLSPIHKAASQSSFLKEIVDSGDIFHPIAWTASETYKFLKNIPEFEKAGIVVKTPNWWKVKQPNRPQVKIQIGDKKPNGIGFDALLDFSMSVAIGEETLDEKEIQELLAKADNLIFFKGQWVELDRERLGDLLEKWKAIAKQVKNDGVSFAEGLRWLSGIESYGSDSDQNKNSGFTRIVSGDWLTKALEQMRNPNADNKISQILAKNLQATLRPYQNQGVSWLNMLNQLRLGAVLADDMGLGKTIQIISLLLLRNQNSGQNIGNAEKNRALLIVPASLIGNWKSEIEKFAPTLKFWIAHSSGDGNNEPPSSRDLLASLENASTSPLDRGDDEPPSSRDLGLDVVITTYGSVARLAWLNEKTWDLVILDEAQAIKNPTAKQTRSVKSIKSNHRLALTGTPVENHLSDLWSLFDFVSPGLLGSEKNFSNFIKRKSKDADENESNPYASLRQLVRPYILRRLKTDKNVISDLPDKVEMKAYCSLSKSQVVLYQKSVESMAQEISNSDGIKRRGIILSYLMRFKQICNHPSQLVKDSEFLPNDSGKYLRLKEICEVIADKQEKVLVFTQFKEMTEQLSNYLQLIFGRSGLVLHGEIPVKKRMEMVKEFQKDDGPPFFVLSLKAGGTGLNLTEASHVIHFDRWWNPAVENQATDRAFRIGQKRNVLVHKFICKGTLEEKVDSMIEAKKKMSKEILEGEDGGALLTELSNEELIKMVSLDLNSV